MSRSYSVRLFLAAVGALALLSCHPVEPGGTASQGGTVRSPQPVLPTAPLCPQATPELLSVEPVLSPTDQLSQTVTVYLGNAEVVTVTAESGTFTASGYPARLEVALLPDTLHHLEVVGRVRKVQGADGCVYGGYTLRTRRDQKGDPLVIQQGEPGEAPLPGAVITPENASSLQPLLSLVPLARLTADLAFLAEGRLVSVGYGDWISLWDTATGRETGRLGTGPDAAALCVAVSPDGRALATGGTAEDRRVRLWDLSTGEVTVLGSHDSLVESLAFNPGGTLLASGGNDNAVRVWDLEAGLPAASFLGDVAGRTQSFRRLFWLDDHTLLGAGSEAIYSWDVAKGELLARLARPERVPFLVDVALSPAGDRLAAAAQDNAVYVWDRGAQGWSAWPAPVGAAVAQVEFSPDGRLLAAATLDGELLLWGGEPARLLARFPVTSGSMAAVRFSPEGRTIALGGWDAPIWLWGIP